MRLTRDAKPLFTFFAGLVTATVALTPNVFAEDAPPCVVVSEPAATPADETPPPTVSPSPEQPPTSEAGAETETTAPPPGSGTLRFSEFLPDPIGDDAAEFTELYNPGPSAVTTSGWNLVDANGKKYALPTVTIEAESYRQFMYAETKLRLTNTGGSFTLEDPTGTLSDQAAYVSPVPTGKSFARIGDAWRWSVPSPGQKNPDDVPAVPAVTPIADVVTTPPPAPVVQTSPPATPPATPPQSTPDSSLPITLSALLPNPDGDDIAEWIELRNAGITEATLDGWKIADLANVTFALNGKRIPAGATLRVMKSESRISLNNTEEEVRLIAPNSSVRETVRYEDAPSGVAYEKGAAGVWKWHEEPETIVAGVTDANESGSATTGENLAGGLPLESSESEMGPTLRVADIAALDDEESVVIEAVVTLPPGVVGKTTFAVRDEESEVGVFVRMYGSGPFPAFAKGEVVRIIGRVKKEDTLRLSSTAKEVALIGATRVLAAVSRAPGDITMEDAGLEAEVRGVVTGRGKRWISLSDEMASSEIYARLASGEAPDAAEGDTIMATGVIRVVNGKLELVVTEPSSLLVEAAAEPGPPAEEVPAIVPASDRRPALDFIARAEKTPFSAWAAAAAITATGVLGYVVWRKREGALDMEG